MAESINRVARQASRNLVEVAILYLQRDRTSRADSAAGR